MADPRETDPTIPIGTYLAKLQYALDKGKLPDCIHEDTTQPFHLAVLKQNTDPNEEFMYFHVSTYPEIKELCRSFSAMFKSYQTLFNCDPETFESKGVRAAFRLNNKWNALLILFSPYKYPNSFLFDILKRISYVLSALYERPSYAAAKFAHRSLIWFMKAMSTVRGIQSVISTYKSPVRQEYPRLMESDSILCEVGPKELIEGAIADEEIKKNCAVFVFGRILYTNMDNPNLFIAELLVANLVDTTADQMTVDRHLFCLAKHFHTVMVTITEPGRGLEKCCKMQVSLMKLDSQGLITKMQQSFAKKLPPLKALDVLVVSGPFTVTQPPFIEAPLFTQATLGLQANAIAAIMYEKMMTPAFNCIVDYLIMKNEFRVKFIRHGEDLIFLHMNGPVEEREAAPLPQILKVVRS